MTLPDSPARWSDNAFRPGPVALVVLGLILVFGAVLLVGTFAYVVAGGVGYSLATSHTTPPNPDSVRIAVQHVLGTLQTPAGIAFAIGLQGVADVAGAVFLLLVLPKIAHASLRAFGFRSLTARDIGFAVIGAVAMLIVVDGLGAIVARLAHQEQHQQQAVHLMLELRNSNAKWIAAALAVVFAPFGEEMVFRVFAYNVAMRYARNFWPAAVVSGVLFGLAHIDWLTLLPLAVGGIILCRVYYATGNAAASMITHGIFNGVSLLGLFLLPNSIGK